MPKHTIHFDLTLRHSYRAGWNHLNDTLSVFTGRMTKPRTISSSNDDERWTQAAVVTLSPAELVRAKKAYLTYWAWSKANRAERLMTFTQFLERATEDGFVSGCRCEYDCCGHTQSYARAKRIAPREVAVRIVNYLNV